MKFSDDIYFDNAATSYPKPASVIRAAEEAIRDLGGNPGRSAHRRALLAAERVYEVRETVARFFDASSPTQVIFTKNATEALNLAIFTLLKEGGHVLCSDIEHNAVLRPLIYLKNEGRIDFDVFKTEELSEKGLGSLLRADTRLLIANHASNIFGRVLPLERIGAFCKAHGIAFVADVSQSAGHLPISIKEMGIDILCAPAHKGLYGILGAGVAVFGKEMKLPPFLLGGSGSFSLSPDMPDTLPERYEAGSLSLPAIAALGAGISYIEKKGVKSIGAHIRSMEEYLQGELEKRPDISLLRGAEHGSGILSFLHKSIPPDVLAERLDAVGVAIRSGYHCAPLAHRTLGSIESGSARIGLGAENTLEECENFIKRLDKLLTSSIGY